MEHGTGYDATVDERDVDSTQAREARVNDAREKNTDVVPEGMNWKLVITRHEREGDRLTGERVVITRWSRNGFEWESVGESGAWEFSSDDGNWSAIVTDVLCCEETFVGQDTATGQEATVDRCGAILGPGVTCRMPKGHNVGQADVPENHRSVTTGDGEEDPVSGWVQDRSDGTGRGTHLTSRGSVGDGEEEPW